MDKRTDEYKVLKKTIFGEARGESEAGQRAVAWVILNRANQGEKYGGPTIKGVCLKANQFECWKHGQKRREMEAGIINEPGIFAAIDQWLPYVYYGKDQTCGSDHYNNPRIEGYPPWTENCKRTVIIGKHQFYKSLV